jgi:hypothetical protein
MGGVYRNIIEHAFRCRYLRLKETKNRHQHHQMVSMFPHEALQEVSVRGEHSFPERAGEALHLISTEFEACLIEDSEGGDGVLSRLHYHPKFCGSDCGRS